MTNRKKNTTELMSAINSQNKPARVPGKKAVRAQFDRITQSTDFDSSQRSRDFLRFLIEQTLAGRMNEISQHAIATAVFGRGDEFDPTIDPIVRMQAGRVRRSLEHYYLTAGAADPVLITLPKGTYVPLFEFRQSTPIASVSAERTDSWPTLLVSTFRNLTGNPEVDFIAQGLASDLATELSHYTAIHVFLSSLPATVTTETRAARFEVAGIVAPREGGLKITVHLLDHDTGQLIWAHACDCPADATRGTALDELVQTTAAMVAEEHGILSTQLLENRQRRPLHEADAYEAILRHHHFEITHAPQDFIQAFTALKSAVKTHPNCGLCWSYLARLGALHWATGMPDGEIPIEETLEAARRGVALNPSDPTSRLVLGYVHLVNDQIDRTRNEAEKALELNQNTIFWLDAAGYLLTLSGDWDRGPELIRRAVKANPFHRKVCHAALWIDAIRRDDPSAALAAARAFGPPAIFWHPLMCAVALVEDGRMDEAAEQIKRILQLKSDFAERGNWLISRYVKFPELVLRIENALSLAGLKLSA